MKFENKVVMITGSRGGIGKALLKKFAENGATIYAHMREYDEEMISYIDQLSSQDHVNIYPVYFDICDREKMNENVRKIISEHGAVDILVNNAGKHHIGLFQMTSVSTIRSIFDVNLFSMMELTQLIIRYMMRKKIKGSIINTASVSGFDLKKGNCAYGISKAGVADFTKILASELASTGIRVNAVAPGPTDTPMAEAIIGSTGQSEMTDYSSMGRMAKPEEIADVVCFLASEESSFVNGETIRVDGCKQ